MVDDPTIDLCVSHDDDDYDDDDYYSNDNNRFNVKISSFGI